MRGERRSWLSCVLDQRFSAVVVRPWSLSHRAIELEGLTSENLGCDVLHRLRFRGQRGHL